MSNGIRKVKTSDLELKDRLVSIQTVSYTHLTLPTSDLV